MRKAEYVRKDAENILLTQNALFLATVTRHIEDACKGGKFKVTLTLKCDADTRSFLIQTLKDYGYNADAVYSAQDNGFNFEVKW